jgi:hypothetical protein
MKKTTILLLSAFVANLSSGAVDESQRVFESITELRRWAQSSSHGGGKMVELEFAGRSIYYTDRMFTYGRPTCELIFYIAGADAKLRPFLISPIRNSEFKVQVESDTIVVSIFSVETRVCRHEISRLGGQPGFSWRAW